MHNSKQTEFSYRAAWARTYLKKFGLIENPKRGCWIIAKDYDGEDLSAREIVDGVRSKMCIRDRVSVSGSLGFLSGELSGTSIISGIGLYCTCLLYTSRCV